jgi:hypothetical protein
MTTPIRPSGTAPMPSSLDGVGLSGVPTSAPTASTAGVSATAVKTPAAPDATRAVLTDLRAGRIAPDAAVQKLTELAVEGARCPPAMRPAVEARIRSTLASDPLLGSLLRRMGASLPEE